LKGKTGGKNIKTYGGLVWSPCDINTHHIGKNPYPHVKTSAGEIHGVEESQWVLIPFGLVSDHLEDVDEFWGLSCGGQRGSNMFNGLTEHGGVDGISCGAKI